MIEPDKDRSAQGPGFWNARLRGLWSKGRDPAFALSCQVISSATNFLTAVLVAHAAGLNALGVFSLCFLMCQIARNFQIGVVLAPMAAIAPTLRDHDLPGYSAFLARAGLLFALISTATLVGIAGVMGAMGIEGGVSSLVWPLALANLSSNMADYMRRYHFVFAASGTAFAVDLLRNGVQIFLIVWLFVAPPGTLDAGTALLAIAAGGLAGTIVGISQHGSLTAVKSVNRSVRPRHRRFIIWMTPGFVFETLQMNGPLFLASGLLGNEVVGLARAMQQFSNILNLPINSLQHITPTMAARARASGGDKEMNALLFKLVLAGTAFIAFSSVAVLAFSDVLIPLILGSAPTGSVTVLLAFLGLNAAMLIRFPFTIRAQSRERPLEVAIAGALGAAVSIGTFLLTLPWLQALAIPLAAGLGVMTNLILMQLLGRTPNRAE